MIISVIKPEALRRKEIYHISFYFPRPHQLDAPARDQAGIATCRRLVGLPGPETDIVEARFWGVCIEQFIGFVILSACLFQK